MGTLLLISLGCTLVASLVFIPALLASVPRPAVEQQGEDRSRDQTRDRPKIAFERSPVGRREVDAESRD
jgi:hypothetical protein